MSDPYFDAAYFDPGYFHTPGAGGPYFDCDYFDPTYFDTPDDCAPGVTGGHHALRRMASTVARPPNDDLWLLFTD